jgi:hypothetical protein
MTGVAVGIVLQVVLMLGVNGGLKARHSGDGSRI